MFAKAPVIIATVILTTATTHAQTTVSKKTTRPNPVKACLTIKNDLDRLACYDNAAGRRETVKRLYSTGKWHTRVTSSALTDQKTVVLTLASENTVACKFSFQPKKVELILRCMENTTSMYFTTDCHMTSGDYGDYGHIRYRVDKGKAGKWVTGVSTDNRALGLWRGGKSIPAIKKLLGKVKLVTRMTPYGESPIQPVFNISGIETAIKPLRKACGW